MQLKTQSNIVLGFLMTLFSFSDVRVYQPNPYHHENQILPLPAFFMPFHFQFLQRCGRTGDASSDRRPEPQS